MNLLRRRLVQKEFDPLFFIHVFTTLPFLIHYITNICFYQGTKCLILTKNKLAGLKMADFRPGKCLLPNILRDRKIEPVDFYYEMNWSKQQYSDYVNNKRYMSLGTARKAADWLGIPIDDLYDWIESPPSHARE